MPTHGKASYALTSTLLLSSPDVAPTGETPMTCAAYYGHTDVIKELIENGADVNLVRMDGTSPLWLAANAPDDGGEAAALELLEAGAKADIVGSRGGTALHGAAFHGRAKLASSLIVAGCPVNAVNSKTSYTALHTAAETKHPKVGLASGVGSEC